MVGWTLSEIGVGRGEVNVTSANKTVKSLYDQKAMTTCDIKISSDATLKSFNQNQLQLWDNQQVSKLVKHIDSYGAV